MSETGEEQRKAGFGTFQKIERLEPMRIAVPSAPFSTP
jgi:hypothetical protein